MHRLVSAPTKRLTYLMYLYPVLGFCWNGRNWQDINKLSKYVFHALAAHENKIILFDASSEGSNLKCFLMDEMCMTQETPRLTLHH